MKGFALWMSLGVAAAVGAAAAYFLGSAAVAEWALLFFGAVGVALLVQAALSLDRAQRRTGGLVLQGAGTLAVVIGVLVRPDGAAAAAAYAFGLAGIVMFGFGLVRQRA